MTHNINNIPALIRAKYSCVSYARDILGLPVSREGDRCTSLAPGSHSHSDAFVVYNDYWHDFTWGKHGDIIDLCALTRHNGDLGEAMRELAPELFTSYSSGSYLRHSQKFSELIDRWHHALRTQDRDYLHSRRITDETIDRLKIGYSEGSQRLITPYWKNGQPVYWSGRDVTGRWKTDPAHCPKYKKMCVKDQLYAQNTIWGQDSLAPDFCGDTGHDEQAAFRSKFLCILEGQMDALSFWQEKWHVISPVGGFFAKKLMPVIAGIARNYEAVFICFDNDPSGDKFRLEMSRFMFAHNIPFICGHTQHPTNPGAKYDVSDYYSHGGDLAELVKNATDGAEDLAASFRPGMEDEFEEFMMDAARFVSPPKLKLLSKHIKLDAGYVKEVLKEAKKGLNEARIADELLSKHKLLHIPGDSFYEYQHGVWKPRHDAFIQGYVKPLLGRNARYGDMVRVTKHASVMAAVDKTFNADHILNLANGILDLSTLELRAHDPLCLSTIQLNIAYDELAACPQWEQFISEIMSHDPVKIRYLKQVIGYSLVPGNPEELAFMLMGDGANGKSVLIETLRSVLGEENCSDVELSNMADRFEPMALKHSLVNFSNETNVNVKGAEAAIKKIISGQKIRAAHKGVDAESFAPRCKIICACNSYINSNDLTYGFLRRFSFINFRQEFSGDRADKNLLSKLRQEAPGILNWIIDGYRDYMANGFIHSDEDAMTREEFMYQYNPIASFIRYGLDSLIGQTLTAGTIYSQYYVPWTTSAHTGTLSMNKFFIQFPKVLKKLRPEVENATLHGYSAYRFPSDMERSPDAEDIFVGAEAGSETSGHDDPETQPVKTTEARSVPATRIPDLTPDEIKLCRQVCGWFENSPYKPGEPNESGMGWHQWQYVPEGAKIGYVADGIWYIADGRTFIRKWEMLMQALHDAGLPCTFKHALMFNALYERKPSGECGDAWYVNENNIPEIVKYVRGMLDGKE